MGHRAEKNRLRHGYKTTMTCCGEKGNYSTERPHVMERGLQRIGKNRYANVDVPVPARVYHHTDLSRPHPSEVKVMASDARLLG